jgi:beta-D-galactosyl-(1->4)-L-rhamnose phosphorylase
MEGGDPAGDARRYWMNIRRALLRQCVDRIGLGGYLSLTLPFPDFNDCIEQIAGEFRQIKELHKNGMPATLKPTIAVLTAWGNLRSWTLSGHFHETYMHELIHVLESLSGLPFDVRFISFEDAALGIPDDVDVIINAGREGSAWSGGDHWKDCRVVENITGWVHNGGAFIGIGEPSATDGFDTRFRLAHILGVDMDNGEYVCHGKWPVEGGPNGVLPQGISFTANNNVFLKDAKTKVLLELEKSPAITANSFGKGMGVYLASYSHGYSNARALMNLILLAAKEDLAQKYISSNPNADCAYYPGAKTFAVVNNTGEAQKTTVRTDDGEIELELGAFEMKVSLGLS